MNLFLIVGLGIVLSCTQALAPDPLAFVVNKQNNLTEMTKTLLHDLRFARIATAKNTLMALHVLQLNKIDIITKNLNNAIQQVETGVSLAAKKGKNATSCLDTIKRNVNRITKSEDSANKKCVKNALNPLKTHLNTLDSKITLVNTHSAGLDRVLYACYVSKTADIQECTMVKLLRKENALRNLQRDIDLVIESASLAANTAAEEGRDCLDRQLKSALTQVSNVTFTGLACTRKA
ncbi:hypothetical protein KM043_017518 [Ampulex compressa]|nr:hypothetical protein KM043_017518 [Ampulex compressa]